MLLLLQIWLDGELVEGVGIRASTNKERQTTRYGVTMDENALLS